MTFEEHTEALRQAVTDCKAAVLREFEEHVMVYLAYFLNVCRHKWWVLVCGMSVGAPLWRLLIHDWSKFLPSEFIPMARHRGRIRTMPAGPEQGAFERAITLHYRRNDHHWQHWQYRRGVFETYHQDGQTTGVPEAMPLPVVREMVADWMAATYRQHGRWPTDTWWPWLDGNWDQMRLHQQTRDDIELVLTEVRLWPRQSTQTTHMHSTAS